MLMSSDPSYPAYSGQAYPGGERTRNEAPVISSRLLQGLQAKQQIISELIAGQVALLEAASRFQLAHAATADCLAVATMSPGRMSDSEQVCRAVIGWVYLALAARPEEAERVSERLERELQTMLDRFGTVNLPPVR